MDREHRQTSANKQTYSTMSEPRRADVRPSFHSISHGFEAPPDDHYNNEEHRPQRRRINTPDPVRPHFPGDGYDFRRPVMSGSGAGSSEVGMQESNDDQEDTIDLTSDGHEQVMPRPHLALPRNPMAPLASGLSASSHAQRLPRFQRDIIDLADSDEDDHQPQQPQNFSQPEHMDNAQDEDSLFIPEAQPRRTTAGLRRPGFMRQLSPAMDLDDIEFVGSRPLSRAQSRRATPANGPNRTTTPNVEVNATIDLTADDDDDDVIHTNTRELPSINGDRPAMAGSGIGVRDQPAFNNMGLGRLVNRLREARPGFAGAIFGPYINGIGEDAEARAQHQRATRERANAARDNAQNIEAQLNRAQAQNVGLFGDGGRAAPPPRPRHLPTIRMDYNMVGFDLGFGIVPNRPPTPKYEPPPAVEKGFTRSPVEEEEVVCPNCGDELAVGKGETKQQIYVVKTCGHAYCGECATREKPSKKGKSRATDENLPPPLKKCVVVGCGKSASKSQMIHVFMSS